MKHTWIPVLLAAFLLTGCGTAQELPEASATPVAEQSTTVQPAAPVAEETPSAAALPEGTQAPAKEPAAPAKAPKPTASTAMVPAERPAAPATPAPTEIPLPAATPVPTAVPTAAPTEAPAPQPAYGAIPFDLAAQTGAWFQIDATDSAYPAAQEQINAIRGEGGLPALTMSSDLSRAANARCESFVAGGPFDHSGMTTLSEICAKGPIGSAQAVCKAWKESPDHYANIMRTDISQMGVACWFCSTEQGDYTYWTVTFG